MTVRAMTPIRLIRNSGGEFMLQLIEVRGHATLFVLVEMTRNVNTLSVVENGNQLAGMLFLNGAARANKKTSNHRDRSKC